MPPAARFFLSRRSHICGINSKETSALQACGRFFNPRRNTESSPAMNDSLHSALSNLLQDDSSNTSGTASPARSSAAAETEAATSSTFKPTAAAAGADVVSSLTARVSALESQMGRAIKLLENIASHQATAAAAANGTRKDLRRLSKHYEALRGSFMSMADSMSEAMVA